MIFMYTWLVKPYVLHDSSLLLSKIFQYPSADYSSREHSREQKFKSPRLCSVLSLKKFVNIHNLLLFHPP